MTQRAVLRRSIAVAATCAMAAALAFATAPVAAAATPTETVIPAAWSDSPNPDPLGYAGPGGFEHTPPGAVGPVWTKFSGGSDALLPPNVIGWSMGTDSMVLKGATSLELKDADTGYTFPVYLQGTETYAGASGSYVLAQTTSGSTVTSLYIIGGNTAMPVSLWPVNSTIIGFAGVGDANDTIVEYRDGAGNTRLGYVALPSGNLMPILGAMPAGFRLMMTDKYIAWYVPSDMSTVYWISRSYLNGPVTTVHIPAAPGMQITGLGIAGDWLAAIQNSSGQTPKYGLGGPLTAVPMNGGSPVTLLAHASPDRIVTGAGGFMVDGGSSVADWAARRVTQASNGSLTVTAMDTDPPVPAGIDGLSLAGGQLLTIEQDSDPNANTFTRRIQLGGTAPTYSSRSTFGISVAYSACGSGTGCPPIGTGDGRMSQLLASAAGDAVSVQGPNSLSRLNLGALPGPVTGGRLEDSDGRYVVYDNPATGKQYIGDVTLNTTSNVLFSRPLSAAALSGRTLWTVDPADGSVGSTDLTTQQPGPTVNVGATCVPSELQAAADRWLYWSCGASGPAGVHDLATGADIPVPAGLSQLGDGFVVEHDTSAGKLVLTDVHTDTAVSSDLATLPAPAAPVTDDRRLTWAVDKYGGGIAYLDAQKNVHIVDPHIPASPATGYRMLPGQRLNPGDSLTSGSMRLVMQSDGNLVAYLKAGGTATPEWSSNTWGHPGAYAVMQSDGNLVVYPQGSSSGALWASGTWGHPGAYAVLQDDGNLVIYQQGTSDAAYALWASGSYARSQTISSGEVLTPGWWTQGTYTFLVMQRDGNLVMYRKRDGAAIWSSSTWGHSGAYAVMQSDGNLVVYRQGTSSGALWASNTWGHPGAYAIMQNDGNLVVYPQGSSSGALWASNTWQTAR